MIKQYYNLAICEGLRLSDLTKHQGVSKFTEPFMLERRKIKGPGNISSELFSVTLDQGKNLVTFKFRSSPTIPTEKHKRVVVTKNFKLEPTPVYIEEIQLLDFFDWLKVFEGEEIKPSHIKELFDILEIKYYCFCPSYHFQGSSYVASQFNASVYPTNIPQKEIIRDANGKVTRFGWKTYQKENNFVCKHLDLIFAAIPFFKNPMASMINKKLKEVGLL